MRPQHRKEESGRGKTSPKLNNNPMCKQFLHFVFVVGIYCGQRKEYFTEQGNMFLPCAHVNKLFES